MREYITCAAIHFDDGKQYVHQPKNITQGFVVCGHRHHNCFMTLSIFLHGMSNTTLNVHTQGFLTSLDRFVDREEGGEIAFREKQIDKPTDCLFSEDLY